MSDLNRKHTVTLTEGQMSTILYILEGYINPSDDYAYDPDFREDVDNIFIELEGVVDKFYDQDDIVVDTFTEQLEVKKYIRDNPIPPEKVTQTQLKSIKGDLL